MNVRSNLHDLISGLLVKISSIQRYPGSRSVGASTTREDQIVQHLNQVAINCQEAGPEFFKYIDYLMIHVTSNTGALNGIRIGVKITLEQRKVRNSAARIDQLQSVPTLATVLALELVIKKSPAATLTLTRLSLFVTKRDKTINQRWITGNFAKVSCIAFQGSSVLT